MTTSHIFYIPLVLLVGFVLGLMLGRRSAFIAADEEAQRQARREARRRESAEPEGAEPSGEMEARGAGEAASRDEEVART